VGLLERVDAARGDVPRARWVTRALEDSLVLPRGPVVQGSMPVDVAPVVRAAAPRVVEEKPQVVPRELPKIAPRHWAKS
jgi:hypothetical protein